MPASELKWEDYAAAADEWLCLYACAPAPVGMLGPQIFAVGHALEMFLKAAFVQHHDAEPAWKHNLLALWQDAKECDPSFMAPFTLHPKLITLATGKARRPPVEAPAPFTEEELIAYSTYQEVYLAVFALTHLKYLGTPSARLPNVIGVWTPSPFMINFMQTLRRDLGWPTDHHSSVLNDLKDSDEFDTLSDRARFVVHQLTLRPDDPAAETISGPANRLAVPPARRRPHARS